MSALISCRGVDPSAASPITMKPDFCSAMSERLKFVTCATLILVNAPADDFHAVAVTPTLRRSGRRIASAPKAAADLDIAPRLRGSVNPSHAMMQRVVSIDLRSAYL